jgi:hypothetical protein
LNEIDKDQLSNELIRLDNFNMKDRALRDIYEALVVVGKQMVIDCLRELEEELKKYSHLQQFLNRFNISDQSKTVFFTIIKMYVIHLPQESESLQRGLFAILQKYQTAIRKYCAYSNMEFIKYLMIYSSKKMLTAWDSTKRTIERHHFANKTEMVRAVNEFKLEYEECGGSGETNARATEANATEANATEANANAGGGGGV